MSEDLHGVSALDDGATRGLPCSLCLPKMLLATQVQGDAFVARVFDNEDDFRRLDFTLREVSSGAPWIKVGFCCMLPSALCIVCCRALHA